MKIDRRSFLSFVIGGAAGTALTPLPWKITDDLAIWSQNWPWTPVPPKGENSYTNSVCTLCPGGCGISVRKVDERAVKIDGQAGHPINDGGVCILGLSGLQLLYGPHRVKTPLKRTGKRGEGKWKALSWDEAITEVADKLSQIRSNNQPHTVGCILDGKYGTVSELFKRFMSAYGSPNVMFVPTVLDSLEMAAKVMGGIETGVGFDLENADYILSFSSGIIDGWGSPVRMFRVNSGRKDAGLKIIQVETRLSNTAAKSDQWLPINPGTEAALAMGLIHVIIRDSLYNADFVQNYTSGFSGWKRRVLDDYSPQKVNEITGIDASEIEKQARAFAAASHPLAICGRGQGDTPVGLNEAMAVYALNALVGNINQTGGVWSVPKPDYVEWPELELDGIAEEGLAQNRIDGAGSDKYPLAQSLLNRLPGAVLAGNEYPLGALFIAEANPCYSMPGAKTFHTAIQKIPFVVSFSPYMDETAMNADFILPNHVYLEGYQDLSISAGLQHPMIGLAKPVVAPLFDTQHTGDVLIGLAQAMGTSMSEAFAWDSYEACLEETLGDKWDLLDEEGIWIDEEFQATAWGDAFATESAKFEFGNEALDISPGYASLTLEGDEAAFPLVLVPYDSMRLANGYISDPPFMMKTIEDTVLTGQHVLVEINPKTAKSHGFHEGALAVLSTPKGQAKVKIHLYEGMMPGVIALPKGLGHKAADPYMAGKGVNINELMGPVEDQASGLDAAWGIRAKLVKA